MGERGTGRIAAFGGLTGERGTGALMGERGADLTAAFGVWIGERGTGVFRPASLAPVPTFAAWRRTRMLPLFKQINIVLIEMAELKCEVRDAELTGLMTCARLTHKVHHANATVARI